jgi:hypothetical protein
MHPPKQPKTIPKHPLTHKNPQTTTWHTLQHHFKGNKKNPTLFEQGLTPKQTQHVPAQLHVAQHPKQPKTSPKHPLTHKNPQTMK